MLRRGKGILFHLNSRNEGKLSLWEGLKVRVAEKKIRIGGAGGGVRLPKAGKKGEKVKRRKSPWVRTNRPKKKDTTQKKKKKTPQRKKEKKKNTKPQKKKKTKIIPLLNCSRRKGRGKEQPQKNLCSERMAIRRRNPSHERKTGRKGKRGSAPDRPPSPFPGTPSGRGKTGPSKKTCATLYLAQQERKPERRRR